MTTFRSMRPSARGYTLLELVVSVGLFSLVMVIVLGAYLTLIHLDRKARATSDVMTNLAFVVDSMTREMRTGTSYQCSTNGSTFGTNCTSPGVAFRFEDGRPSARTVTYYVEDEQIFVDIEGAVSALTDPRVRVTGLNFYVRGVGLSGSGNVNVQPQATFVLHGTIEPEAGEVIEFSMQGGATQRLLEFAL